MAKKQHIIKERLSQMYCFGAEPFELMNCLKESQKKLIGAGAKADNLPKALDKTLQFLSTLPPKAHSIVLMWFRSHVQFPQQGDPQKIIHEIQLAENNDKDIKPLWRAILGFYVTQPCPDIVTQFLRGEEIALPVDENPSESNDSLLEQPTINVTDEDIEQCLLISQGCDIPSSDRVIPAFVAGLVATLKGEVEAASEWTSRLSDHPLPLGQKLGRLISTFGVDRPQEEADNGIVLLAESIAPDDINGDIDEVSFIGKVMRVLPSGEFFVLPIGLFIDNELRDLSNAYSQILYPERGEVIGYSNRFTKNMVHGELGIWQARHKPSDKTAQYALTDYQSRVYPVVKIPYVSGEPDAIRQWLLTCYQPQDNSPAIFFLTDGLALRLPGDILDPKKYDFDVPLDSYRELSCVKLRSQSITIVPQLPGLSEKYDCAPASTWIKRLLKLDYSSTDFPVFSKSHLQRLAHFMAEYESDNRSAYLRALTQLEQVAVSREFLDDSIQQLLTLPTIKTQIYAEKQVILAQYESEQEQLRQTIASLMDKKTQLDAEINRQEKTLKSETNRIKKALLQQEAELDSRIRQTFEQASQAGIETLAQTALLRTMIAGSATPTAVIPSGRIPEPASIVPLPQSFLPPKVNEITSKRVLQVAIEEQAAVTGLSENLLFSLIAAANVVPVVGLTGKYAQKTVASLANILSGSVWGEVSIHGDLFSISDLMKSPVLIRSANSTSSMTLGDFLAHQQSSGLTTIVKLRGFNRMPPETLLPELNECLFSSGYSAGLCWKDQNHTLRQLSFSCPVLFVLTFAVGKSTFPLQGPVAHQLPVFVAEYSSTQVEQTEYAPAEYSTDIAPACVASKLWSSLYADAHPKDNQQQTMRAVLNALGYSDEKSQALAMLAFTIGRSVTEKITAEIEPLAPALIPYVQEITHGTSVTVLDHLFQL
ncbi:kinetochore protein [Pectobacterium peruviense]|uniref:coiled-coil domain-containing protein n=1 Tax=Pectobacterium peruviense TaxID=2066479 RepID=UPI000DE3B8EF|nr:kinetochore protein [Pectobacterium peruviense]